MRRQRIPHPTISLRTTLAPGDLGWIVHRHGVLYACEHGFDATFEAYVAGPLAEFVRAAKPRERIWLAECDGRLLGCVAIVEASADVAQVRWFLVEPEARGAGLGRRLLLEALAFCRQSEYRSVMLWTVRVLTVAAHLYRAAGFRLVEEKLGRHWGVEGVEERYEITLED